MTLYEKTFASEDEASEAAERIADGKVSPKAILICPQTGLGRRGGG